MTTDKISEFLISKNLDEFYFAIIENIPGLLSDKEYKEINDVGITFFGENKDKAEETIKIIDEKANPIKGLGDFIKKKLYSSSQVRYTAILTMIEDKIYDIGNAKFIDTERKK